jgi:hypothetical protein
MMIEWWTPRCQEVWPDTSTIGQYRLLCVAMVRIYTAANTPSLNIGTNPYISPPPPPSKMMSFPSPLICKYCSYALSTFIFALRGFFLPFSLLFFFNLLSSFLSNFPIFCFNFHFFPPRYIGQYSPAPPFPEGGGEGWYY